MNDKFYAIGANIYRLFQLVFINENESVQSFFGFFMAMMSLFLFGSISLMLRLDFLLPYFVSPGLSQCYSLKTKG